MYPWSSSMNQISLKNSFGKVVYQILAEIEMTQNKISHLVSILKQWIFWEYFFFLLEYGCF